MATPPAKLARYAARKAGAIPTIFVDEQECRDCRTTKQRDEFGVDHSRKNGLKAYCNDCVRTRWIRSKYGIEPEEYERMLEAQDHLCAICRQPERTRSNRGKAKRLSLDHDHITGVNRGFLCDDCNVALGRMHDDPDRLIAAAMYLLQQSDVLGRL